MQTVSKPSRSFSDPNIDQYNPSECCLNMQLGRDAFQVAVHHVTENKIVRLEEYIFDHARNLHQLKSELEAICKSLLYLQKYQQVLFGWVDERSTLIPESLYDEDKKASYFALNYGPAEKADVCDDKMVNARARNIYLLPVSIVNFVREKFGEVKFRHASTSLIESMTLQQKQMNSDRLILHIQYSHFEIAHFKGPSLQFFNSFQYTTSEDLVYYTLFVFEQLALSTEQTPVTVYGELEERSGAYELLYKYIRKLNFGERSKLLTYSTAMKVIPDHHYFNLYQQYLCV